VKTEKRIVTSVHWRRLAIHIGGKPKYFGKRGKWHGSI